MREIKFRAWDKKDKFMVYSPCPDLVIFLDGMVCIGEPCEATDNFILMQFTGLLDKNGKKIYEGDIVKNEFGIDEVYFNEGEFKKKSGIGLGCSIGRLGSETMEVIGNIYENPELLREA